MKCTKCGFVSFDYLSECKKCATSLAGTREALGLATAKPAIPSFLGSLLKDYEKPPAQSVPESAGSNLPSFDFADEFDNHPAEEVAPPGQTEGGDLNLLEISDEELEFLIEAGMDDKGEAQPEDTVVDPAKDAVADTVAGPGRVARDDSDDLTLDFAVASPHDKSKGPETPKQAIPASSAAEEESLQIELTDQDLETLLTELEHSGPNQKKVDPEAEIEPEKPK